MTRDLTKFNTAVTASLFFGSLPSWQADPLKRLIYEGDRRGASVDEIAYVLATAYHETARFKTNEEYGKGAGHPYGRLISLIAGGEAFAYYGRGYCQLTWLGNYAKMTARVSAILGQPVDFVSHPDLACKPEYAALIIWAGMIEGIFTGRKLTDYISNGNADFVSARRIINGTDQAELIAGYAEKFKAALEV